MKLCLNRDRHLALRIDGHKFSTFTQGFDKPFDLDIMEAMCRTAEDVLKYFHGRKSKIDEITVLIPKPTNDASSYDFNGRKSKIETLLIKQSNIQRLAKIFNVKEQLWLEIQDLNFPTHILQFQLLLLNG